MKFTAFLLIVCIVFLSSFSGRVKPFMLAAKADCCAKSTKSTQCAKHTEKKQKQNDCEKQGCNMFLTCSICGFMAVEPVSIKPAFGVFIEKPVLLNNTGNSAVYLPSDWKPPKV